MRQIPVSKTGFLLETGAKECYSVTIRKIPPLKWAFAGRETTVCPLPPTTKKEVEAQTVPPGKRPGG
jgi:hypothetical protein